MNNLTCVVPLAALIAVLAQLGSAVYSPGGYKTCLSCLLVNHPHECKTFTEVSPHERCFTEILRQQNGSFAYRFGYENSTDCIHSYSPAPAHGDRQQPMSSTDIPICHECCTDNLCNRKLCGIPESNNTNLACLFGMDVSGLPLDTSITYCDEGEQCYRSSLTRAGPDQPNLGNYSCASESVCDHLRSGSIDGGGTLCQNCCGHDGCNAHICHTQGQDQQGPTMSATDTSQSNTTSMTSAIHTSQSVTTFTISTRNVTQNDTIFTDCWELRNRGGFDKDGIYDIYPAPGHSHLRVRCDMTTDGGGWTVLQKRYTGLLNFTRTFQEYQKGFGAVSDEYWLGLEWMHILTSQAADPVRLRVDMSSFYNDSMCAVYDRFYISGQNDTYSLHTGQYMGGSLGDELTYNDNDTFKATGKCADEYRAGWWYYDCAYVNLNGGAYNGSWHQGIWWWNVGPIASSEMKIRPVHVTGGEITRYACPN